MATLKANGGALNVWRRNTLRVALCANGKVLLQVLDPTTGKGLTGYRHAYLAMFADIVGKPLYVQEAFLEERGFRPDERALQITAMTTAAAYAHASARRLRRTAG